MKKIICLEVLLNSEAIQGVVFQHGYLCCPSCLLLLIMAYPAYLWVPCCTIRTSLEKVKCGGLNLNYGAANLVGYC